MKTIEIVEKEYPSEQQKLIDIFKLHGQGCAPQFPITLKAPRTTKPRTFINRIPCKTIGGQGDYHLVSMEVIDFVRLMAKCGIEVKIYDDDKSTQDDEGEI